MTVENSSAVHMAEEMLRANEICTQTVLASLKTHIVVLDGDGTIIAVNQAWERFARENGDPQLAHTCVGINYLKVCHNAAKLGNADAQQSYDGITAVLAGASEHFAFEYDCHSSREKRWFTMSVTPLGDQPGVVVAHETITARKQAEAELHKQKSFVELLQVVAMAANQATSFDQALQASIDAICTNIGWPVGHIYLPDPDLPGVLLPTNIWYLKDAQRFAALRAITEGVRLPAGIGLPGQVLLSRKPAWLTNIVLDVSTPRTKILKDLGLRAGFALPVLLGGEVSAVLEFFSTEAIVPDEALLNVLYHAGNQLGRVVERARGEALLRESEERFRHTYEYASIGVAIVGLDGRWLQANPALCALTGYSEDELLATTFQAITHPTDLALDLSNVHRLMAGDVLSYQIEKRYFHKNGTTIWILLNASLVRDGQGQPRHFVSQIQDISERKHAELALRESEERFRTVWEGAHDAMVLSDADGIVLEANSAYYRLYGYGAEQIIGQPYSIIFPLEQRAARQKVYREYFNAPQVMAAVEAIAHRADGAQRWVESAASFIIQDGQRKVLLSVIRDITERKNLQIALLEERALLAQRVEARTADLSAANAELSRAARLKDEFLASMSHELRTPLNAILGLSEALQEEIYGPVNARQRHSLHSIEESGRHLLSLINDVLDLAKVGAGKLELQIEPAPVEALCQASLRMVKQIAHAKQITIESAIDRGALIISVDARRLKQILVNLLSNAVKFTPEGGKISLTVQGDVAAGRISFAVRDTGIGIAPEHLPQLFQPFVQLDSRLARQYAGTGLGLALVARMVEMHGGSIAVESTLGVGSCFTIVLPWQPVADTAFADEPLVAMPAMAPTHSVRRALIIEDSAIAADQIGRYLAESGVRVDTRSEGRYALAHALVFQPDLIVLDILLPDMSGWEVLAQLKADPRTRPIPVAVASVVDERAHGLAAGAVAYLVKPVMRSDITLLLDQLARAHKEAQLRPLAEPTGAGAPIILLAEDNESNILMLRDYLSTLGYHVASARNGSEAIDRAREIHPALILMDVQMPGMDGIEATRHIRADDTLKAIPILALTALAMPGDRERCLAAGANDYLSKPISLKGLALTIATYLQPAPLTDRIHQ